MKLEEARKILRSKEMMSEKDRSTLRKMMKGMYKYCGICGYQTDDTSETYCPACFRQLERYERLKTKMKTAPEYERKVDEIKKFYS